MGVSVFSVAKASPDHNSRVLCWFLIHFDLSGNVKQLAEVSELYPVAIVATSVRAEGPGPAAGGVWDGAAPPAAAAHR